MATPSVKIIDSAGNIPQSLASTPAGTETALVVRNIPSGIQNAKITDGTNTASVRSVGTSPALNVSIVDASGNQITSFGAGSSSPIDSSTFTAGTSTFSSDGGVFNDSLAALTSGTQATARLTGYRALHTNLRTSANTEFGFDATTNSLNVALVGQTTGAPVIGTLAAANATVVANVGSAGNCTITVKGTFSAQFIFEASDDSGTTWYPIMGSRADGSAAESTTQLTTISTGWNFSMPGFNQIRVRCLTYVSGTVTVRIAQGGILYAPTVNGNVDINGGMKPTYRAVSRRITNTFTAGGTKQMWTLHHAATVTKNVRIRKITFGIDSNSVAGVVTVDLVRITTAPTGTVTTIGQADTSDPAATTSFQTLISTAATESIVLDSMTWNLAATASTFTEPDEITFYHWEGGSEQKPLLIRSGVLEGICLKVTHSAASVIYLNSTVNFTEE